MKNKKILALLLACTIMASGVPVYAADFSDGTAESVQDAESSLFGMEDSELTEDTMPAFADMEENADAAQITDGNSEEEDLTGDKTEDKGTEGLEYEYVPEIDGYRVKKGVNEKEIRIPEKYEGKEVLEIGEGAFAGCDQIERIRILDHHKNFKIKKDAFENCISLRKVSFFGGIKVESGAFRNCPKLYDFALINYYEGTEVSIADDAFDADSKVLVSADGGLPWKGSPEPFFNENGEDGWHEKEQGMDYWDYVKNNGPSQYEGTRVADFDNSVSKVRIRDNVKGIGRKAFYGSDRLEETFLYGTLIPEYETVSGVLAYRRKDEKNNILILTTSLADGITLPFTDTIEEVLLNNYDTCEAGEETIRLQPYQCLVLKVK